MNADGRGFFFIKNLSVHPPYLRFLQTSASKIYESEILMENDANI